MCKGKPDCRCMKRGATFRVDDNARLEKLDGRDYAVFSVVMAKPDVVMNDSLFPADEYFTDAWQGVPVTITHPETENGGFLNANEPAALEKFCVGRIFNAQVRESDQALIGEAWIDVEKIQRVDPETFAAMQKGMPLDVSTGFYSMPVDEAGEVGGVTYSAVHTGVIPNHLALLPNEDGACSWENGCGVRVNKKGIAKVTMREALARLTAANAAKKKKVKNAEPDDKAKLIDAMVAAESSPFEDGDKEALAAMTDETLAKMAESYCKPAEQNPDEVVEPDGDEAKATNADEPKDEKKKDEAAMNKQDREALAFARRHYNEHKAGLVAKIVANSTMVKADVEAMDVATLEKIANGLHVAAVNYSGVPLPETDASNDIVKQMSGNSVVSMLKKKGA